MDDGHQWHRDGFTISTDKRRLNLDVIHVFLRESYWAKSVPRELVARSIENTALCFGIYRDGADNRTAAQVGFARVITDRATFAYLADVFVLPGFRGRALSKWLMEVVVGHPDLQGLRRFLLATADAHGLYAHSGFAPLARPDRWMEISPGAAVYTRLPFTADPFTADPVTADPVTADPVTADPE